MSEFFQTKLRRTNALDADFGEDFCKSIGNFGRIKSFPWNVGGQKFILGDYGACRRAFYVRE